MKKYNLSQEQLQTLFDLFDSGMKPKEVAQKTGIEYKAVVSVKKHQYLAKKKGFKSLTEYREDLARSKSINVIINILYEKEASAEEIAQGIREKYGFSIKSSTIERKIKQFQFTDHWVTFNGQTKKYKLDKEHWFVNSMMQELFEE
ncbi:MAG: hypothetical protein QMD36_01000 [Candidatus Aenigmarchaeota archaeon]|nr:hypothetical protein [Candidatus Aenigmarchaeota archaeon]